MADFDDGTIARVYSAWSHYAFVASFFQSDDAERMGGHVTVEDQLPLHLPPRLIRHRSNLQAYRLFITHNHPPSH